MSSLRCCFLPQDLACLLVGIITFIIASFLVIISSVVLIEEHKEEGHGAKRLGKLLELSLTSESLKIICCVVFVVALLWMLFSIMLVIGIKKNRPSYLLSYFGYGNLVVILLLLSGLLMLLTKQIHWAMALTNTVSAMFYIYCLMSIHALYEEMQHGIQLGQNGDQLAEALIQEFNEDPEI